LLSKMTDLLPEIEARLEAATRHSMKDEAATRYIPAYADFIAHAPEDIAWLLEEVKRLQEELDLA